MLSGSDVAAVRLAQAAYLNTATGIPSGFTPATRSALGLTLGATEGFTGGVYTNQNAAALVTVGTLNGVTTLVLAFRGSDDRQDSIADLRNINSAYPNFSRLIAAVDGLVSRQAIPQVLVTGHSLGGAMAQLYMASHPDNGRTQYVAETVGSPGVLQAKATDSRITNLQVADDPAVAPVFRFFDTHSGSHFYTSSTTERDGLSNGAAGLTYEGVAFYENTVASAANTAVYRFFDNVNGTHFYTPDQNEYAGVLATRGDLVNEGSAFYTQKA